MYLMSTAAMAELRQSHTAVTRLEVLHSGRRVYTLTTEKGAVNAEANRTVMRNLRATVVDPTGALSGRDIKDLLSPYDCEVAPYRGVLIPGVGAELVPLGVFGLTGRAVAGFGSVDLTGQDRAMGYQGPMSGSLAISGNTPVEEAITRLLATRNHGLSMVSWATGFTTGPLLFPPDIDVWKEAQNLAESVGGYLYHTRTGQLVFGPGTPTTSLPAVRYAYGDGLLLGLNRVENADDIHNVVKVISAKAGIGGVITAEAADNDPTSPTYAGGRFLRRVKTISNQHLTSVEQAEQMAATELVRELGRTETVTASVVAAPYLDPWDPATVHHPGAGLLNRGVVIDATEIPLSVEDDQSITFRRSILTRDGQVLAPSEVTTA